MLNKEAESNSEDDTYKPFDSNNMQQLWHNAWSYPLETPVMGIIEPRIGVVELNGTLQQCYMVRKKENGLFTDKWYSNDAALVAAKQDLEKCYKKVLAKGAEKVAGKEHKSIGLPALGTEVGFPRKDAAKVAVTSISEFIKNNPDAYNLVHLFVKKRSEAILYYWLFTGTSL